MQLWQSVWEVARHAPVLQIDVSCPERKLHSGSEVVSLLHRRINFGRSRDEEILTFSVYYDF
jgi:hypothetical protein